MSMFPMSFFFFSRSLGMDESLFKRLELHGDAVVQLNVQYRMNRYTDNTIYASSVLVHHELIHPTFQMAFELLSTRTNQRIPATVLCFQADNVPQ